MNILFTSVGRRGYILRYFKEILGDKGKVFASNGTDNAPAFKFADEHVITPLIYDQKYIPFLLDYCLLNNIKIVISLFDIDLPILSRNKDRFKDVGVKVIVSEPGVIDICNDKWKTFKWLKEKGFETVKTFLSTQEVLNAIKDKNVTYPLIVKPRWGMGSIAIQEIDNEQELTTLYEKVKKQIQKTYLLYESNSDLNNCVIVQEKIEATEYGLDVINDLDGNYVTTIVKEKLAMRSGETDSAVTVNNEVLQNLGGKIGNNLGHIANLDVDVFLSGDKAFVLEMNARFGGGYPFSHLAGVNLPKAILSWINGEKPDGDWFQSKIGIRGQKDINVIYL
ncbi:MAG: ATP-grasp domain-containing protein [Cyclobacterium sp.]|uniref:ATP-grasp domain-containing protein n=1 Tax=Cyclobacterium sp. TaxID=1966343 RepID=UPI003970C67D